MSGDGEPMSAATRTVSVLLPGQKPDWTISNRFLGLGWSWKKLLHQRRSGSRVDIFSSGIMIAMVNPHGIWLTRREGYMILVMNGETTEMLGKDPRQRGMASFFWWHPQPLSVWPRNRSRWAGPSSMVMGASTEVVERYERVLVASLLDAVRVVEWSEFERASLVLLRFLLMMVE